MVEYEIKRWDSVLIGNNTFPFPMIYIKPDSEFLKKSEKIGNILKIQISDTGLNYDAKETVGVLNNSGYYPNYRPNFFNETGFYTITLSTNWIGYPLKNGKVLIKNVDQTDKENLKKEEDLEKKITLDNYKEDYTENSDNLNTNQIGLISIVILVFFGVFAVLSFKKN